MRYRGSILGGAAAILGAWSGLPAAQAAISISNKPTQNMSCDAGVCTATGKNAVLNVGDLENMLGSGDVAVKTGSITKDINIDQPLTWADTSRLTLDAQQSVVIKKQVAVTGAGSLTVTTNESGTGGEFIVEPERGSVQFADLASSLTIDGNSYALEGDIKTLGHDISRHPSGFYALAHSYDASADGPYTSSPVAAEFEGTFEGLGNKISKFVMTPDSSGSVGLFASVGNNGAVRDIGIVNAKLTGMSKQQGAALLAELNNGGIIRCWAKGNLHFTPAQVVGGLVAGNGGSIMESYVDVEISGSSFGNPGLANIGGLAGANWGTIAFSYALGSIALRQSNRSSAGGLVGEDAGIIENSYAMNRVKSGRGTGDDNNFGGVVGSKDTAGSMSTSYAAGEIMVPATASSGGFVGYDGGGNVKDTYWNLDDGVSDPSHGAGNIKNDRGITGLTTEQLQSGLPDGFKSSIWAQSPDTNNGYPYLRHNPPRS